MVGINITQRDMKGTRHMTREDKKYVTGDDMTLNTRHIAQGVTGQEMWHKS